MKNEEIKTTRKMLRGAQSSKAAPSPPKNGKPLGNFHEERKAIEMTFEHPTAVQGDILEIKELYKVTFDHDKELARATDAQNE